MYLRRALLAATAVTAGVAGTVSKASAGGFSLAATVRGQVAATDNVFSAPDEPAVGAPGRESDVFFQIRPGLLATFETPRTINEAVADVELTEYAKHTDAWGVSYHANIRNFFLISPRTEMTSTVDGGYGQLNALTARDPTTTGAVVVLPAGNIDFRSGSVGEILAHSVNESFRVNQTAVIRYLESLDSTNAKTSTLEATATLGGDHLWKANALGLTATASYLSFGHTLNTVFSTINEAELQLAARWRHDLSAQWNVSADGGMAALIPLNDGGTESVFPVAGVSLSYFPVWGAASLSLRHGVAPNLFIAENTVNDTATVTGTLPLPWGDPKAPKWSVQTTLGAQRSQLIDTTSGAITSNFDVFSVDAALIYAATPAWAVSLRYQYIYQGTDTAAVAQALGFTRDTLLLSVVGRWPEQVAVKVPNRTSMRVDGSDLTPVGDGANTGDPDAPLKNGATDAGSSGSGAAKPD